MLVIYRWVFLVDVTNCLTSVTKSTIVDTLLLITQREDRMMLLIRQREDRMMTCASVFNLNEFPLPP